MMVHPSLGEFNLNSTYLVKYVMPLPLQTTPCHLQRSNDGVSTVWYDPLACDRIRADSSNRSPVRSPLIDVQIIVLLPSTISINKYKMF